MFEFWSVDRTMSQTSKSLNVEEEKGGRTRINEIDPCGGIVKLTSVLCYSPAP